MCLYLWAPVLDIFLHLKVIFEAVAVVHSFQGRVDFLIPVIQNEPF